MADARIFVRDQAAEFAGDRVPHQKGFDGVGRGVSKAGLCAHNGPNDGPHIILLWRKFFWDLEVIDLARIVQQLNRSRRHFFVLHALKML
jgi:hypothetical protein